MLERWSRSVESLTPLRHQMHHSLEQLVQNARSRFELAVGMLLMLNVGILKLGQKEGVTGLK